MSTIDQMPKGDTLPFPSEQLPPTVYNTYDREQITYLLFDKLEAEGIDPKAIVFTGFDADEVLRKGTFGERTTTFGVGMRQMIDAEDADRLHAVHSPVAYVESDGGRRPAIAAFRLEKLVGGSQQLDDLREYTPEELQETYSAIFWATKNGAPLDTAVAKLFLF